MATDILTGGYESLRPGEMVTIAPMPGFGAVAGQVLGASAEAVTIAVAATPAFPNGFVVAVPANRIASVSRQGTAALPATLVRAYKGQRQADAVAPFQAEANGLAEAGYEPVSQSWADGQWGGPEVLIALLLCLVVVGVFILIAMLVVRPEGTLTVTYTRARSVSADASSDTKPCPRCAETVKAAAVVCRFCGHEFAPTTA